MTIPVSEILANANSRTDIRAFMKNIRFYLFETDYKHGTRMELDFADVSLLRCKYPSVERIIVPSLTRQGENWLGATIELMGKNNEDYTLMVKVLNSNGVAATEVQRALSGERSYRVNLDMSGVKAGLYSFHVSISDKNGAILSEQERKVEVSEYFR